MRWIHSIELSDIQKQREYGLNLLEARCSSCQLVSVQLVCSPSVTYEYCPRCGEKRDGIKPINTKWNNGSQR